LKFEALDQGTKKKVCVVVGYPGKLEKSEVNL